MKFIFCVQVAFRRGDRYAVTCGVGVVEAANADEARGKAARIGDARFPARRGWTGHAVSVGPWEVNPTDPDTVERADDPL